MKVKEAVEKYLEYQKSSLKPHTFKNYRKLLTDLQEEFKDREIEAITSAGYRGIYEGARKRVVFI